MIQNLIILGSTGSIGRQTLEIVAKISLPTGRQARDFRVLGLAAGSNWQLLLRQIRQFQPKFVVVGDPLAAKKLAQKVQIPVWVGEAGILKLATQKGFVVSALAGVAGLAPTLAALRSGNDVALANKESLVLAGDLVIKTARKSGARIFPIDSEHSGVWQLLAGRDPKTIRRVILTASGGALRDLPLSKLKSVTPKQVLAHPNWDMGAKVTVDSATMVNKAFEIIEAHQLFGLPYEKIEAVIHPQSLVHALVEFIDGSILAQLAEPDMRLPIQLALFRGKRQSAVVPFLELAGQKLEFQKIDIKRYPLFDVILNAAKKGGLAPAVAALAAEVAAERFLAGKIKYLEMTQLVQQALRQVPTGSVSLRKIQAIQKQFQV
jgi:1-deoxy-D-xylulose-5-phosphate reductoisomerase